MELICINSSYSEDFLKVFAKHNIKFPQIDEIVELVRVDKLIRVGKIGLIVSPYDGQFIKDMAHGIEVEKEVSFAKERFATLLGQPLTEEMLKEFQQEQKDLKKEKLLKINPNENIFYNILQK